MESHVVWSAQACPFRRAGVYYGLSPCESHPLVARCLLPRRGALFARGTMCVRPSDPCPLVYFAVRDPSAVKVVPVRPASRRNPIEEFAHVSLVFPIDRHVPLSRPPLPHPDLPPEHAAELDRVAAAAAPGEHAGFVVTIGLRIDREREFHERLILANPNMPYAQLCERIMALRSEFSK